MIMKNNDINMDSYIKWTLDSSYKNPRNGKTVLHIACEKGYLDIVKNILEIFTKMIKFFLNIIINYM